MTKKICYIGGMGRSGSTILGVLLAQSDGVFYMGEGIEARQAFKKHKECTCGETAQNCPVWGGGILKHLKDADRERIKSDVNLVRGGITLHRFILCERIRRQYAESSDRVFDAIFTETGAGIVVDSSQNPSRGIALLTCSRYDVYFLHLVRDCRGYINSINRDRLERGQNARFAKPLTHWTLNNVVASASKSLAKKYTCIRFENLVQNPRAVFEHLGDWLACDLSETITAAEQRRPLGNYHFFSGNPRLINKFSVQFNPSAIQSNELKGLNNALFWYGGGWISTLWGYTKAGAHRS